MKQAVLLVLLLTAGCGRKSQIADAPKPVPCQQVKGVPNTSGTWWTDENGTYSFTVDDDDLYQENKRLKQELDRLRKHGAAVTHTPDSPAITGDGNTVTYNK